MALDDIVFDLENPIEATRIRAVVRLVRSSDIRSISYLERVAENDESAQIRYLARKGLKLLKDKALDDERRRIEVEYLTGDMEQTIDALVSSHDQDDRRRHHTGPVGRDSAYCSKIRQTCASHYNPAGTPDP